MIISPFIAVGYLNPTPRVGGHLKINWNLLLHYMSISFTLTFEKKNTF
jgi:hypothetical protein